MSDYHLEELTQKVADLERRLQVAVEALKAAPHDARGFGCAALRGEPCNCMNAAALKAIQSTEGTVIQNTRSNIGGYCSCGDLIKQTTFRSCSTDEIDQCPGERRQNG